MPVAHVNGLDVYFELHGDGPPLLNISGSGNDSHRLSGDHRLPVRWEVNPDTLWGMCRQITCRSCGRPGWAGCGAHVEQVLGHVPQSERCQCSAAGAAPRKSWFKR